MNGSAADAYARANSHVVGMLAVAMRADDTAIGALVEEVGGRGPLDPHTAEFIRRARATVLGACAALSYVLRIHRMVTDAYGAPVCSSCGTTEACKTLQHINTSLSAYRPCGVAEIDRAEAWRRADRWLNRDAARPLLIHPATCPIRGGLRSSPTPGGRCCTAAAQRRSGSSQALRSSPTPGGRCCGS